VSKKLINKKRETSKTKKEQKTQVKNVEETKAKVKTEPKSKPQIKAAPKAKPQVKTVEKDRPQVKQVQKARPQVKTRTQQVKPKTQVKPATKVKVKEQNKEVSNSKISKKEKDDLERAKNQSKKIKDFATKEATKDKQGSDKENFELKYKELLATTENLRKKAIKDKQEIIKYRASSFIQEMLPGLDMLEASINAKNTSKEVQNWLTGFKMIMTEFKNTLAREGVTEIPVKVGDVFDPDYHMAIEKIAHKKISSGKIVQVNLKGYLLHGRLLRASTVVVAK